MPKTPPTPDYIVLKHLCREYDMDAFKLRKVLRKEFGKPESKRWKWDQNNKAEAAALAKVRSFLSARTTSKSSGDTTA